MLRWLPKFKRSDSRLSRRKSRVVQPESLEARTLLTNFLVTVENLSPDSGLGQTPFWVGFHDGTFDIGNGGEAAFGGLEELAEEGDTSVLSARFNETNDGVDATITAPEGFGGAPVFEAGETVSFEIEVDDPNNQYFSFATMIIPSNDAFIANLNPEAYKVFRNNGNVRRPFTIEIFGSDVYDAGTEVNNPFGGAAFSTEGGEGVTEDGVIRFSSSLDSFVGTGTPVGDLGSAFDPNTPIARITVSQADNPSDPIDNSGPLAALGEIRDVGDGEVEVDVVYTDPSGVDLDSITSNDIVALFQNSSAQTRRLTADDASVVSSDPANRTVTATYTIDASAVSDADIASLRVKRGRVHDAEGNRNSRGIDIGDMLIPNTTNISVTVENLADPGGIYLTPFFVGVHDGGFDLAQGRQTNEALEALAEDGETGLITEQFAQEAAEGISATITSPEGFPGAPVFDPGEVVTEILTVTNPGDNQFFTFASMLIPSNDAFVGNLGSRAYRLFNNRGGFRGPVTIMIYGNDVWDAGTEVNNPQGGAPFSTEGGESVDENGRIRRSTGLDDFVGTGLPTGGVLERAFSRDTPIARITIDLANS